MMKHDSYSDQQSRVSFQPRSPQPAIEPTQFGHPVQHSSSTSGLGANWLNKASGWVANKFQTAQNFVNGAGDAIPPDQILPALRGSASSLSQAAPANQPLVGVIDAGFGTGEHGSKMVEAIQKENPQAKIWKGGGVGTGGGLESLVEFVDVAKATGRSRAVANLSFDLTEVHPDGSTSTRTQLTAEEQSALAYARDNGVLIVASSGNQGGEMSALGQASQRSDNLIVVGAANGSDSFGVAQSANRASYSSYGEGLDLVAEAGSAGTSLAAASVTGAIAQMWATNPGLSSQQISQILTATSTDLNKPGWDAETGAGLLNAKGAIDLATHTTPEPIVFSGAQLIQQARGSVGGKTWEGRNGTIASERTAWFGDWVHGALDVAGFIPGVGAVADVANAALYAAKGDYANAAMSAAAAVPGIGDAAAAVKLANRGVQAVQAANRGGRATEGASAASRPRPSRPPAARPASSNRPARPSGGRPLASTSRPRPERPPAARPASSNRPARPSGGRPLASIRQQISENTFDTAMDMVGSGAEQYFGDIEAVQGAMDIASLFSGRRGRGGNSRSDRSSGSRPLETNRENNVRQQPASPVVARGGGDRSTGRPEENIRNRELGGRRDRNSTSRSTANTRDRQPVAVGGGNSRTRPSSPSTTGTTPSAVPRSQNSRADSPPAPRSGGSGGGNKPPRKPPTGGGGSRPTGGYDDSNNNGLPAGNSGNSGNSRSHSNRPVSFNQSEGSTPPSLNRTSGSSRDPYNADDVREAGFDIQGIPVTRSPYVSDEAVTNGRFFTYSFRDKNGEVRYVGSNGPRRRNDRGAATVFRGRMGSANDHDILNANLDEIVEIRIEGFHGSRDARSGAEQVLYSRYQTQNPIPAPNGDTLEGGINEGGRQLLNRENIRSARTERLPRTEKVIEEYSDDLWTGEM